MTPEYMRHIRNNVLEAALLNKEVSLTVPISDTLALTCEVDRLTAENAELRRWLAHYAASVRNAHTDPEGPTP